MYQIEEIKNDKSYDMNNTILDPLINEIEALNRLLEAEIQMQYIINNMEKRRRKSRSNQCNNADEKSEEKMKEFIIFYENSKHFE